MTLITHTSEPEKLVAAAAKLCYSPSDLEGLMDQLTPEKSAEFVRMLSSLGHQSPMEHVSFTFGIQGVSRALLAQITRHRIASYSVQSQRYVSEHRFDYVVPPEIEAVPEAKAAFAAAMEDAQRHYDRLAELLRAKHLQALLETGMEEKAARRQADKQAMEDARFVLPNACDTKMIVTMNARSLHNFFLHRCCNRAQWEIRELADRMLALAYGAAPTLFASAGPGCVSGSCPEGKMSCGRMGEVRAHYQEIKGRVSHGE